MTLEIITETSAVQQQLDMYNRSSGMVKRTTYSPPPGTAWAVIGLVLDDTVTPADEAILVAAMEALDEITTVANSRIWGQIPGDVLVNPGGGEDDTHEVVLIVESQLGGLIGYGTDLHPFNERQHERIRPPLAKKWLVCNLVLPSALTGAADVTVLEAALEGVADITIAEHLIGGLIPVNASQVSLVIITRMRIDPIPIEE